MSLPPLKEFYVVVNRDIFLTTISTTCGAINVPAPLKEFYVVVNRDILLTTISTTCGAINVPAATGNFKSTT